LQRPTELFVKTGSDSEILAEKTVYGEGEGDANNHRTRIYQHFDNAGVATNGAFDFKGNLLSSTRQLVQDYKTIPDWLGNPGLETEVFSSSSRFDGLNRPIQLVAPHSNQPSTKLNVIRPGYNEANLLERMDVWLGEAAEPTVLLDPQAANFHAVTNIDHDAKGQRTLIEYGNGAKTEYTYDQKTFRLTHLKTTRGGAVLQDLFYTYDPVGNITRIRDDAQQTIFFKNQVVLPQCDYTYDAIYRLIEATGREHIGQAGQPQETKWDDEFRVNLPHPGDGQAMRNYTEQYVYDAVGNFEKLIHQAANGSWTRGYAYNEASLIESGKQSNRLSSSTVGARTEPYTYDAHGNMVSMPHLMLMQWNYKDELSATSRQAVNDAPPPSRVPETTFYVYDAGGERVRKVTERQNGTRKNERIYLGGFEIYREFKSDGNDIKLERETLHVMDDKQRIALVETKSITNPDDEAPTQLIRFQFGNHLGSSSLELDNKANAISYEEYYPYGSTAYQAVDKSIKAPAKRYRYTGMERDEESGLNYHAARYYLPWLGRWCSSDPIGISGGINVYLFSANNPINFSDKTGNAPDPPPNSIEDIFTFIRNQAGFETGAEKGISFSSKAASPFGTAAHSKATSVLDTLKQIGVKGAERIYSEIRTVGGVVTQIGGTPGGPKGSFNLDLVAVQEGKSLSVGDSLTSAVGEVVGDLKYGGGVISPKYNALGIPLSTVNGNTVASTAEEVNALVSAAKAEPLVAEAGAVSNLLAKASPALSKLAPIAEALAPAAKFVGKAAGPLGIGIGVAQIATAKNTEGKIDGGITAISSALMMSKHPVAMAAGGGLMAGQVIEKTLDVSKYSSDHGIAVYEGLKSAGVNDTASFVAGGVVTVLSTPLAIQEAAIDKSIGLAKWAYHGLFD